MGNSVKVANWESRLMDWVEIAQKTPFSWGVFDCALMASDAVLVQTGVDPAESFRNAYTSKLGALKAMQERGFDSFEQLGDKLLGDEVSQTSLKRGDIILTRFENQETFGVFLGRDILLAGSTGLLVNKTKVEILKGWRAD